MPLSRSVYKQPPVKGKILYRNGEPGAPKLQREPAPAAPPAICAARRLCRKRTSRAQSGSAAGCTGEETPAVGPPAARPKAAAPPDQATITAAVASLAEQEG